jgi:hypothetical protein
MLKHPKELGFKPGLKIYIGKPARIRQKKSGAETRDVVYVALFATQRGVLEKQDVLKVGQTGGTLEGRWKGIAGIFDPRRKLRPNVESDREKWLKVANRREVVVWMKPAEKIRVPYSKGLSGNRFSIRCAEEEFLDQYYEPRLGKTLNRVSAT